MNDSSTDSQNTPVAVSRLLIGNSPATRAVHRMIDRAARVESTVLITGESGVGKELVAREIHARSTRKHSFVPLNCAAIPESLIEAELFGNEKGAFTDACRLKRGAFELADQGTLFLDEVGDLSMAAQPKLLRALESREIVRVGGEQPHPVDLRIIAATNHRLRKMCRDQRFRTDLYYRLCVIEINVPPLRERIEDVRLLAEHFARGITRRTHREFKGFTEGAMKLLQSYSWPGNVRELKSSIERALAVCSGYVLDTSCFELNPISNVSRIDCGIMQLDWRSAHKTFESLYFKNLLERHAGNVQSAAQAAGLAPGSIYKVLRRLELHPQRKSN